MIDSHHHRRAVLFALVATRTLIAHRTSIAQAQHIVNMSAIEQNGPLPRATTCTGSVYNLIVYRNGGRLVVPVKTQCSAAHDAAECGAACDVTLHAVPGYAFVEADSVLENIGGAGISGSLETGLRFRYGWNP